MRSSGSRGGVPGMGLRKGKWTLEEETYANKIILSFNQGLLSVMPGTTLRSYLSGKLNCDPMRITKKYAGASCIGKQVFQASEDVDLADVRFAEEELNKLEAAFLNRLHGKAGARIRTSDRTSSAAAAAAAAASASFDGSEQYDEDDDGEVDDDGAYDDCEMDADDGNPVGVGAGAGGGSWSEQRRRKGDSGLSSSAGRYGGGGAKNLNTIGRRVLSAPNLQVYQRRSPNWNKVKRSYSSMDLEDFGHFVAEETSDSAAAVLLLKLMSNIGKEPSLSRPTSSADLLAAEHLQSVSWGSAGRSADTAVRSLHGSHLVVKSEQDKHGDAGTDSTSRSSSQSRTGSMGDTSSTNSTNATGGTLSTRGGRKDSRDSASPVGLTMDDDDSASGATRRRSKAATLGVFGSSSAVASAVVQVRPTLGDPPP